MATLTGSETRIGIHIDGQQAHAARGRDGFWRIEPADLAMTTKNTWRHLRDLRAAVRAHNIRKDSTMSETKHTPEPWEALRLQCAWGIQSTSESADPDERVCHLPYHFEYRGEPCGSITSQNKTNAEIEANARRIVACVNACEGIADPEKAIPALVEACHEALCVMMHYRGDATPLAMHPDDVADMARAAIALARGEG